MDCSALEGVNILSPGSCELIGGQWCTNYYINGTTNECTQGTCPKDYPYTASTAGIAGAILCVSECKDGEIPVNNVCTACKPKLWDRSLGTCTTVCPSGEGVNTNLGTCETLGD
jgi:hypothetical protein